MEGLLHHILKKVFKFNYWKEIKIKQHKNDKLVSVILHAQVAGTACSHPGRSPHWVWLEASGSFLGSFLDFESVLSNTRWHSCCLGRWQWVMSSDKIKESVVFVFTWDCLDLGGVVGVFDEVVFGNKGFTFDTLVNIEGALLITKSVSPFGRS